MMSVIQKKIILMGNFAVGKTSLVRRYVEGRFSEKYLSTIGVQISRKTLRRGDIELKLILWDVAGGEDFIKYQPNYLRGAAGAILVCDLTRRETLESLPRYLEQFIDVESTSPIAVLLGNKADLETQFEFDVEDLRTMSEYLGVPFLLTSAKTGNQVEEAFETLADLIESPS
jgi:small GTP-binding protein